MMKENWQLWSEKFSNIEQREKLLILFVGLFVLGYVTIWFVLSPLHAGYSNNKERIINLSQQQKTLLSNLR